jgi:hypothetical protein
MDVLGAEITLKLFLEDNTAQFVKSIYKM